MNFKSNAEEIKYYLKECLDSGEEKTTQQLIQYVEKQAKKKFTNGSYSGAINDFMNREAENYGRIRYGVYRKLEKKQLDDLCAFDDILKDAIAKIEKAKRMDIDKLTPEKLLKIQERSRYILDTLYQLLENDEE